MNDESMSQEELDDVEDGIDAPADTTPETEAVLPSGSIDDVEVELQCSVGSKKIKLAEIRSLNPGFIVELDTSVDVPVRLQVNGKTIGRGELVQVNGRLAVRIVEGYQNEST